MTQITSSYGSEHSSPGRCDRLLQMVEQLLGIDKVEYIEAFGEPGVDGVEKASALFVPAAVHLEAREACCGSQLRQFRAFGASGHQRLPKPSLNGIVLRMQPRQQLTLRAQQLRQQMPRSGFGDNAERLLQQGQPLACVAELTIGMCEDTKIKVHTRFCTGRGNSFDRLAHFPNTVLQFSLLSERPPKAETGCPCQERQIILRGYVKLKLRPF